jgi:hypothetical protein
MLWLTATRHIIGGGAPDACPLRAGWAEHPNHNFEESAELRNESQVQRDIIAFDMQESRPEATYPLADHVTKADDDVYLRVEAYLASL